MTQKCPWNDEEETGIPDYGSCKECGKVTNMYHYCFGCFLCLEHSIEYFGGLDKNENL